MGGIFLSYAIEFKSKTKIIIEVDSIKAISDSSEVKFYFTKNAKGFYELDYTQSLSKPEKCKTCPDIPLKMADLSKGIIIYYRKGTEHKKFRATKFKQLPDINAP